MCAPLYAFLQPIKSYIHLFHFYFKSNLCKRIAIISISFINEKHKTRRKNRKKKCVKNHFVLFSNDIQFSNITTKILTYIYLTAIFNKKKNLKIFHVSVFFLFVFYRENFCWWSRMYANIREMKPFACNILLTNILLAESGSYLV